MVENLPAMREHPWVRKVPWRWEWQPTAVLLPGEFHGRRSLVGYSPDGHKESDRTEQLTHAHVGLAVLGLHCCMWAFSSCSWRGLLSSCGTQASLCGGFSC